MRSHTPALAAFIAAAIFALHPTQTQAVTYIVQRMTSLSVLFVLVPLLAYIHARTAPCVSVRRWCAGATVVAFLLALGTKEIALVAPALAVLYEWVFCRGAHNCAGRLP